MSRNIQLAPGEYYHIYNRGVDKRKIFSDERDYERLLVLLHLANSPQGFQVDQKGFGDWSFTKAAAIPIGERLVSLGAYCFMPNHFHLLVKENEEGGISAFMKKLSNGYTMYFNKKYDRTGALFEGRFKAKHLKTDNYLKYQYAYIHLNPIGIIDSGWKKKQISDTKKALQFLDSYTSSSYHDYIGKRKGNVIIEPNAFPNYFSSFTDFEAMIKEWIGFAEENTAREKTCEVQPHSRV